MKTFSQIDATDPMPKYLQAEQILTEAIYSGKLKPGSKLPPTKEIGSMINVSLVTAHKALERLVESGLLRRAIGRGTYVCDDVASAIESQRRVLISLVLDQHVNVNDYYHGTIIDCLRHAARRDPHQVEFRFHDRQASSAARRHIPSAAICLHPLAEHRQEVESLAGRIPVVTLGGRLDDSFVPYIDCNNAEGAGDAADHLYDLGHRNFLVLSGPTNLSNSRDRVEGARRRLGSRGLALPEDNLLVSRDSVVLDDETVARLSAKLQHAGGRPTAIIAGGFYLALGALQTMRRLGFRVPNDVSLVGFDDPAAAPLLDPPLTTVCQPLRQMADTAYAAVRQACNGESGEIPSCELPTQLIVRGSTARLP